MRRASSESDLAGVVQRPSSAQAPPIALAPTAPRAPPISKPTMGGIVIRDGKQMAWTGGKPKPDWSGLSVDSKGFVNPNQGRPERKAEEGYNHRVGGLSSKLSPKSDQKVFLRSVWDRMVECGMDTTMYLPDPHSGKMISVVTDHPRFTSKTAQKSAKILHSRFDGYDKVNDNAAVQFILNSLKEEMKNEIKDDMEEDDPAVVVWMRVIETFRSTSVSRYDKLKSQLKGIKPSQYSQENLIKMVQDMQKIEMELKKGGQWDHNLTLSILENALEAGGDNNETFRLPIRLLFNQAKKILLETAFMDKDAVERKLKDNSLATKEIFATIKSEYRSMKDEDKWPPALNPRDSKAPPTSFGAHVAQTPERVELTGDAFAMLLQQVTGKNNCLNCGKEGHWARDCPDKSKSGGGGGGGRNGRNRAQRMGKGGNWKTTPPKSGQPTTIKRGDLEFHWCDTCKHWNTTHTTIQHVKGAGRRAKKNPEANVLFEDPSAWNASFEEPSLCWYVLSPLAFIVIGWFWYLILSSIDINVDFDKGYAEGLTLMRSLWNQADPVVSLLRQIPAPIILWFASLVGLLRWLNDENSFLQSFFVSPQYTRRERRFIDRLGKRQKRRNWRAGSIRDHGLHKAYPRRLRSLGHYVGRKAPTVTERAYNSRAKLLYDISEAKHHRASTFKDRGRLDRGSANGAGRRSKGIDPLMYRGPAHLKPTFIERGGTYGVRCERQHVRRKKNDNRCVQSYVPVPTSTHCDRLNGNCRFTDSQRRAMTKTLYEAQIMMAACSTISPDLAFLAPTKLREAVDSCNSFSVIWDSGATYAITNDEQDFMDGMSSPGMITRVSGLTKGLTIKGQGFVTWVIPDVTGHLRSIRVKAYYVPGCKHRLLSTSGLLSEYPDEKIVMENGNLTLTGKEGDSTRNAIIAITNPRNNLPTSTAYRHTIRETAMAAIAPALSTVHDENINLSEPEKELMRWHYRLAHLDHKKIQFLMRSGVLANSQAKRRLHAAAAKLSNRPRCAACHFGKQQRRPTQATTTSVITDRAGILTKDNLLPGNKTSVDHFICSTKGRLFTSRGKSLDKDMYLGGCIFVDHASGHVHVEFQTTTTTHQTLEAKSRYEAMARDVGVVPQTYLADNSTAFTSAAYSERLQRFEQVIHFAGTGAHHHNGKAERAIRTIMSIARTMMLHAGIHWGEVADPMLWPMAVQQAVFIYNRVPDPSTGLSPLDIFSNTRWPQRKLHDLHVWGSPIYVLDKTITDGKKLPRWKPRSRRCVYMGQSPMHASTVPLVLDMETGTITPQFHVVFDDWFATVATKIEDIPDYSSPEWQRLFGDSEYQYTFDDNDINNDDVVNQPTIDPANRQQRVEHAMDVAAPPVPLPVEISTPPATPLPQSPPQVEREAPTGTVLPWREANETREILPQASPNQTPDFADKMGRAQGATNSRMDHTPGVPDACKDHTPGAARSLTPVTPVSQPVQRKNHAQDMPPTSNNNNKTASPSPTAATPLSPPRTRAQARAVAAPR